MKTMLIILFAMFSINLYAQQEETTNPTKNYLSVELDPAPFILGGYSFSVKFSPTKTPHITYIASVYSSKFPDGMMSSENYDKGFRDLKIKTSFAAFADYFIKSDRTGLHFGPSVFLYSKSVTLTNSSATTDFKSIYPNLRVGYVFKPFKKVGIYVNPWLNVGKEINLGEDNHVDGVVYSASSISYILAVHIGYKIPL